MRVITLICLLVLAIAAHSQPNDSFIFFSGYILDEESAPVEDAILVNIRTLKPVVTNSEGYFKTFLKNGDSLVVIHTSYEQKIIVANKFSTYQNKYYLRPSVYEVKPVEINYAEIKNIEANMQRIKLQMVGITPYYRSGTEYNLYAPTRKDQTFGINIKEFYNFVKTYQYRGSRK